MMTKMKIKKFNEDSNFNELIDDVKTTFSFLVDEGCNLYFKGNSEACIFYDIPALKKDTNEDIDKYIEWVDKISNIANDMKVSAERLKTTHNISYHFYNKIELNRSRISLTINLITDELYTLDQYDSRKKRIIFNLSSIRKEFDIPKDISIRVLYWTEGYTLNFNRTTYYKYNAEELIKYMKSVPYFKGHHYTKTGTLIFKFNTYINITGK